MQNTYTPKFLVGTNCQYIYNLNTWFIINVVLHQWYSYYKGFLYLLCPQQYNIDISDGNQVLLISHVKTKGPAGGPPPGPAMLIPELCYLTGCLLFVCLALVHACLRLAPNFHVLCTAKWSQSDSGATAGMSPHLLLVFLEHCTVLLRPPSSWSCEITRSQENYKLKQLMR